MTVNQLCSSAGITRQWLNTRADRGEVPGVDRRENGRLHIVETRELQAWARTMALRQKKKRGRRLTLKERIDRSKIDPTIEKLTCKQLADKIGGTAKTVRLRVLEIPSAYSDGTSYFFQVTPTLKKWIAGQISKKQDERARLQRKRSWIKSPILYVGNKLSNAQVAINRALRDCPIEKWGTIELTLIRDDVQRLTRFENDIDHEISRRNSRN
jgi:hypothetical protein